MGWIHISEARLLYGLSSNALYDFMFRGFYGRRLAHCRSYADERGWLYADERGLNWRWWWRLVIRTGVFILDGKLYWTMFGLCKATGMSIDKFKEWQKVGIRGFKLKGEYLWMYNRWVLAYPHEEVVQAVVMHDNAKFGNKVTYYSSIDNTEGLVRSKGIGGVQLWRIGKGVGLLKGRRVLNGLSSGVDIGGRLYYNKNGFRKMYGDLKVDSVGRIGRSHVIPAPVRRRGKLNNLGNTDRTVTVRFPEAMYRVLVLAAKDAGVSVSEYVRTKVIEAL